VALGFGFHEAMDQLGAVTGPLLVTAVLYFPGGYRQGFAFLLLPAVPGRLCDRLGLPVIMGTAALSALLAPQVFLGGFKFALLGMVFWGDGLMGLVGHGPTSGHPLLPGGLEESVSSTPMTGGAREPRRGGRD